MFAYLITYRNAVRPIIAKTIIICIVKLLTLLKLWLVKELYHELIRVAIKGEVSSD